jgi:hypothetical protein
VRIEANGKKFSVFFNEEPKGEWELKGSRYSGNAFFYASNPWHPPANAKLEEIEMKEI